MKKNKILLLIGLFFCAIGMIAWLIQAIGGLVVTNLRNPLVWGLGVAGFEFFAGMAAGALLVYALFSMLRKDFLRPVARIAATVSLACVVAAGIAVVTDLGKVSHVFSLLFPRLSSPFAWVILFMTFFVVVAVMAVMIFLRPRGIIKETNTFYYVCVFASVALGIVTSIPLARLGAIHDVGLWSPLVLPLDALFLGYAAGGAVVILFSLAFARQDNKVLFEKTYRFLGRIVALSLMVHFGLTVLHMAFIADEGIFSRYGALFALDALLLAGALGLFLIKTTAQQFRYLVLACSFALAGIFFDKLYVLLTPQNSVATKLVLPEENGVAAQIAVGVYEDGAGVFERFWSYAPSLAEWLLLLLPVGAVFLIMYVLITRRPVVVHKEKAAAHEERDEKYLMS